MAQRRTNPRTAAVNPLSHYAETGEAQMVDVAHKNETARTAVAHAAVRMKPAVMKALKNNPKGDPLEVARIAGIMAAKQTSSLIPMCHPLALTYVNIDATVVKTGIELTCTVKTSGKTGVEMEALTGATVAALTVYDMVKALDKGVEIQDIYLVRKTGGKSGDYARVK